VAANGGLIIMMRFTRYPNLIVRRWQNRVAANNGIATGKAVIARNRLIRRWSDGGLIDLSNLSGSLIREAGAFIGLENFQAAQCKLVEYASSTLSPATPADIIYSKLNGISSSSAQNNASTGITPSGSLILGNVHASLRIAGVTAPSARLQNSPDQGGSQRFWVQPDVGTFAPGNGYYDFFGDIPRTIHPKGSNQFFMIDRNGGTTNLFVNGNVVSSIANGGSMPTNTLFLGFDSDPIGFYSLGLNMNSTQKTVFHNSIVNFYLDI
jgi:hypothetical protein